MTWIRSVTSRRYLPLCAGVVCAINVSACALHRTADEARTNASIARIENDIIAISAAGADSGSARTITERMAALNVPGVSIAVFDSGRIVWAKGYGVRDRSSGAPVDTATVFQAASISKPVTSVAMFRLVEQGRIQLDEDVNTQLQSWVIPDSRFTASQKVTPRRIVTHTSGLTVHGFLGYKHDAALRLPYQDNLSALIHEPSFKQAAGEAVRRATRR